MNQNRDDLLGQTNLLNQFFFNTDKDWLNENISIINYHPNDIIIKQNTFTSQLVYINKGVVKIYIEERNNTNTILNIYDNHNFIGLSDIFLGKFYNYSVTSLTESNICIINKTFITELINNKPELNQLIINSLSKEYIAMSKRISILSTRNNPGRLAYVLNYLTSSDFHTKNILSYISRKDLSELASISLESVNKILAELKNDKIIEIENKNIQILRPDLIKKLSDVG